MSREALRPKPSFVRRLGRMPRRWWSRAFGTGVPSTPEPFRRYGPLPRVERIAAAATVIIPPAAAASVVAVAVDVEAGLVVAAAALAVALTVVAVSVLSGFVSPIVALAGVSGAWAFLATALAWIFPFCPAWYVEACVEQHRLLAAALLGLLAPWAVAAVVVAPFHIFRRLVYKLVSLTTPNATEDESNPSRPELG